jgi:hypothetical protein
MPNLDLRDLGDLYLAGVRIIGVSHFWDTTISGSNTGAKKHGLTEKGKKLVETAYRIVCFFLELLIGFFFLREILLAAFWSVNVKLR